MTNEKNYFKNELNRVKKELKKNPKDTFLQDRIKTLQDKLLRIEKKIDKKAYKYLNTSENKLFISKVQKVMDTKEKIIREYIKNFILHKYGKYPLEERELSFCYDIIKSNLSIYITNSVDGCDGQIVIVFSPKGTYYRSNNASISIPSYVSDKFDDMELFSAILSLLTQFIKEHFFIKFETIAEQYIEEERYG